MMRKIIEEMNHTNMPIKNHKPNNSLIDKNADNKQKNQPKPKPKEENAHKTLEKQKDLKKAGNHLQNNQSIVVNGKDKGKKHAE